MAGRATCRRTRRCSSGAAATIFEAYRFILPGYNVRPLEMSGAIGREQLKKLPGFTAKRRENLALFQRLFRGDNRFIIQRENGKSSSFCFTIVLNPDLEADRDKVFAALHDADIQFRIITGGNFLRHDVIRYFDYEIHGGAAPTPTSRTTTGFSWATTRFDLSSQIEKLYRGAGQELLSGGVEPSPGKS